MTRIKDLIVSTKTRHNEHDKLEEIKKKLTQNSLVHLRLGFDDGEFRSKRDVQSFLKVITERFHHRLSQDKYSCLKSISVGWRLPNFALGPILQSVIPALLQEPVHVTHLQLVLNDNPPIPLVCLRRILSWHSLESVDLRYIQLRVNTTTPSQDQVRSTARASHQISQHKRVGVVGNSRNDHRKENADNHIGWEKVNVIEIVACISPSARSLKLVNCGVTKHHIPKLCNSIRRKLPGLKKLSLRQNFGLDGGYQQLFALPGIKILDLSLCDLDPTDGAMIAQVLEKFENVGLQYLNLAGNYRLSSSVPDIVRVAGTRLVGMDCSFCGINAKSQRIIFDILAGESLPPSIIHNDLQCTIQYFRMQGIMLNEADSLVKCIRHNTSLRHLLIDHPHEVQSISFGTMQQIASAIEWNYSLQELRFDAIPKQSFAILESIEFWLKLNRCGRKALLQTNEGIKSLSNIFIQGAQSNDHNIMFWLLKHGSAMFSS